MAIFYVIFGFGRGGFCAAEECYHHEVKAPS